MTDEKKGEEGGLLVRAGALTRSIKFVLSIFALLLAGSLLFQFTAARDDAQQAQDELEQLTAIAEQGQEQRD